MRIIKHTSRLLTIRDENLAFSGLIWTVFTLMALATAGILFSIDPAGSRMLQALGVLLGGADLGAGILIGAWQAKVRVLTLNLPQESVTVAEGNWLKLHSVDVRPLSDVAQPALMSEEEKISRGDTHIPHLARTRNGAESYSEDDSRMGTTTTQRSYGLKLVMRSGGDIQLSLRHRSWEEAQQIQNAIAGFLSPFRHMSDTEPNYEEEARTTKKHAR